MRSFADHLADALAGDEPSPRSFARDARLDDAVARAALIAADARPAWARFLDVAPTCSSADLRRAFRRAALATHPDREGGSSEAFRAATRALEEGLAAIEAPRGPSSIAARAAAAYRKAA